MAVFAAPQIPNARATTSLVGTYFDHIVFIIMENEGIDNICGSHPGGSPPCNGANTPFMSGLANTYTLALNYTSILTTSQPNYIAIIGGSNFTCPKISCSNINQPTFVVDRLQPLGLTWKAYMETMQQPSGCDTSTGQEPYNPIHNPFLSFTEFVNNGVKNSTACSNIVRADPTSCGAVPDCALINDLNNQSSPAPNFIWLTPNDCNNMHGWKGCSSCTSNNGQNATCMMNGDKYLKSLVPNILDSYTFNNTRSALFITFDEGLNYCPLDRNHNQDCTYAVWAGRDVMGNGFTSKAFYNHYSFLKTLEVNWNLGNLTSKDLSATNMTEFFRPDFTLNATPSSVSFNANSSGTFLVTVGSVNRFAEDVNLTLSSSPFGLTTLCTPTVILGASGNSTCTLDSSTIGSYNVVVNGTSGSISHSTKVAVLVESGSVGGVILPIDKVGLLLQLLVPWFPILVLLPVAIIMLWTRRRK